ncbi:unnamed protein product [Sphenostylis stenocarpa]|uniref:Uncharacterized protein n=1 Tax=Sphenostylis stenocarpa TaxID=92480 RepID=A0AA86W1T1_9FABA|nr:unnamed protein product [Sphenostylis stenocarpa]
MKDFITMWCDARVLSSGGKEEEGVICSSSGVEVGSKLEEEESGTYKASCKVVVESGKLEWEHGEGRCELEEEGSGTLGGVEGTACALVVEGKGICMAS